ncbi:MAG: hypothetical protein M1820_004495 [Bogoriella megaspora]|nr:MAG: hypothetical protein M1820_004495 [Bogoriella megaspora]
MLVAVPMRPLSSMDDSHRSMTSSLAVLPSAPIYAPPAQLPSKRPRLTLDTGHERIYAKGPTSLRLDCISAISPTVRNTFSNTFGNKSSQSPAESKTPEQFPRPPTPLRKEDISTDVPNSTTTLTPSSTTSSTNSTPVTVPYKQPYHLTSILSNSPIPRSESRTMSFPHGRPLFPATKHVSFRNPLAEEIKTEKYTMAHSDLHSVSSSTTISSLSLSTDVLPAGQLPGTLTHSPSGIQNSPTADATSISTSSSTYDAFRPSLHLQRCDSESTETQGPVESDQTASSPPSLSSSASSSPRFTFSLPSPRLDPKHDSLSPISGSPTTKTTFLAPPHLPQQSTPRPSPTLSLLSANPAGNSGPSPTLSNLPSSPRTGEKRDSSSSEDGDDDDDSQWGDESDRDTRMNYPSTPVAGRRKRQRQWVWTLEPLPGMSSAISEGAAGSESDNGRDRAMER